MSKKDSLEAPIFKILSEVLKPLILELLSSTIQSFYAHLVVLFATIPHPVHHAKTVLSLTPTISASSVLETVKPVPLPN